MLRIMLADDHDVIRFGLRHLLERKPEWKVYGEASNGREAAEMAAALSARRSACWIFRGRG